MKKNLLFAVIAGVAVMTGCSKNEVLENNPTGGLDKMEFTPVVGKQVRAGEIISADLQKVGTALSLYGYKTDAEFASRNTGLFASFFNSQPEKLTYNGFWSTTIDYEWASLSTGRLSIFTYFSPKSVLTGINVPTTTAAANFVYTVPNAITDQEDLLVSANLDMNRGNTGGIIAINFKHALSQLYFRAKLTATGYKAVIKSIKVLNTINKGTFTYAVAPGTTAGAWSNLTGKINYIYAEGLSQEVASKDNPVRIGKDTDGSLMLMPQTVNPGQFQFEVTYDVLNTNGDLIGSKIVKTADMAALEMGKKYVYTLILPASENDKIAFDVVVTDWDDTSVATEREVRFDEFKLTGATNEGQVLADLITAYTPTVVYLQEVKVTGTINAATSINLTNLAATATVGSKIILDCTALIDINTTNKITVTNTPTGWSADANELTSAGKITITKQ